MVLSVRPILLLSLLLVGAGCAGPAKPLAVADATGAPEIPLAPKFSTPILVGDEVRGETFLAMDPTGQTILACTHGNFRTAAPTWVSEDGGATFRDVRFSPDPLVSGDCEVAIGQDGTWYVVHSTLASATVTSSADRGKTWNVNPVSAVPTSGFADRPWVGTAQGAVFLSYMDVVIGPGFVAATKSTDKGKTWSPPQHVNVPEAPDKLHVAQGPIIVSPDEAVVRIPIVRYTIDEKGPGAAGAAQFVFATTRDGGTSWKQEPVATLPKVNRVPPSAAIAGDGTLYWTYGVSQDAISSVFVIVSKDDGKTWSSPILVQGGIGGGRGGGRADGGGGISILSMDGRPDGSATIVWSALANQTAKMPSVIVARVLPSASPPVQWIQSLAPTTGVEFMDVEHDASGRAYVLYPGDKTYLLREEPAAG